MKVDQNTTFLPVDNFPSPKPGGKRGGAQNYRRSNDKRRPDIVSLVTSMLFGALMMLVRPFLQSLIGGIVSMALVTGLAWWFFSPQLMPIVDLLTGSGNEFDSWSSWFQSEKIDGA